MQDVLSIAWRNHSHYLSGNTSAQVIARGTPGFSGADLANLINIAALTAARDGKLAVSLTPEGACTQYAVPASRSSRRPCLMGTCAPRFLALLRKTGAMHWDALVAHSDVLHFSNTCTWVQVPMRGLEYARDYIVMGAERKSAILSYKSQQSFRNAAGMHIPCTCCAGAHERAGVCKGSDCDGS